MWAKLYRSNGVGAIIESSFLFGENNGFLVWCNMFNIIYECVKCEPWVLVLSQVFLFRENNAFVVWYNMFNIMCECMKCEPPHHAQTVIHCCSKNYWSSEISLKN